MAESNGESICCIVRGGNMVKMEQVLDHMLNLMLLCPPITYNSLFYLKRSIIKDFSSFT